MTRRFHQMLGLLLSIGYLYVMWNHARLVLYLGMTPAFRTVSHEVVGGYLIAYALPVTAISCFLLPRELKWRLSPRIPPSYDYLLTDGAWYILGYGLLAVGIGVLLLFR